MYNYQHPYPTAQQNQKYPNRSNYQREKYLQNLSRQKSSLTNKLSSPRDNFPEISQRPRASYSPSPSTEKSSVIKPSIRDRYGLMEQDYFSPEFKGNLNSGDNLGFRYKSLTYTKTKQINPKY